MSSKEATARIKINKMLEEAGWRFIDEGGKKANIKLESNVRFDQLGDDFENHRGSIDFLLLDEHGKPLLVLEAKKESIEPLSAKEQIRKYALANKVRHVILSNGNVHYLWDLEQALKDLIQEKVTRIRKLLGFFKKYFDCQLSVF